jgi:hypothetical protein
MKLRLYGGGGHGRMVFLPTSTVAAPETITLPVMTPVEFAKLWPLDPEMPSGVVASYRDTGDDDTDGYRRYEWIPEGGPQ